MQSKKMPHAMNPGIEVIKTTTLSVINCTTQEEICEQLTELSNITSGSKYIVTDCVQIVLHMFYLLYACDHKVFQA